MVNDPSKSAAIIDSTEPVYNKKDTALSGEGVSSKENNIQPSPMEDSVIAALSRQVLLAFKQDNARYLLNFIHPTLGLRFSPYGYVDTVGDVTLDPAAFGDLISDPSKKIKWGNYDGSGDPIELTFPAYIKKFIYDVDFINAEKVALNSFIGHGNSLNNLEQVYPETEFVEYYFSGFDKKYEGMDWRSLRIVFKKIKGKYYLLGLIHDQWTT